MRIHHVPILLLALLIPLVAPAPPAAAHGATVSVSWSGVVPDHLTLEVGGTVHFTNANSSANPCTVVADDDSFESPPLKRGEGWHHTFKKAGSYGFHVKEMATVRGVILVVPKE